MFNELLTQKRQQISERRDDVNSLEDLSMDLSSKLLSTLFYFVKKLFNHQ